MNRHLHVFLGLFILSRQWHDPAPPGRVIPSSYIPNTANRRPIDSMARRRPMDPTAYRRPMDPTARIEGQWILRPVEGPRIIRPAGGPWLQQSVCCHDYFGLVSKNRLLWPLEEHRKRTAVTTSKQLNKTIRK